MQVIGFFILVFIFSFFLYLSIKLVMMGAGKIVQRTSGKLEKNKRQVIKGIFFICFNFILLVFYILIILLGIGIINI